jgi:hypothetical protein
MTDVVRVADAIRAQGKGQRAKGRAEDKK